MNVNYRFCFQPMEKCDFQNFNREVLHVLLKFLEIIKTEVGQKLFHKRYL